MFRMHVSILFAVYRM